MGNGDERGWNSEPLMKQHGKATTPVFLRLGLELVWLGPKGWVNKFLFLTLILLATCMFIDYFLDFSGGLDTDYLTLLPANLQIQPPSVR